jgi:hypothetical protein
MPHPVDVDLRITLRDDLVRQVDSLVGPRHRAAFIARAVEGALENAKRRQIIESAMGTIDDRGHEWDGDPTRWAPPTARRRIALARVRDSAFKGGPPHSYKSLYYRHGRA